MFVSLVQIRFEVSLVKSHSFRLIFANLFVFLINLNFLFLNLIVFFLFFLNGVFTLIFGLHRCYISLIFPALIA